jgi:cyclic-di-GMP-binding protein
MAQDHSFDIVSKPDLQEIGNALQMAGKELANRFDFKGSISKIEHEGEKIKVTSEDEFKLKNVIGILQDKLVKRKIPLKFFDYSKIESALGGVVRQVITIQQGIPQEKAKDVTKLIKSSGLKVQAQIQGDEIRVFAKKIDDLQALMQQIRAANFPIELQFINFR